MLRQYLMWIFIVSSSAELIISVRQIGFFFSKSKIIITRGKRAFMLIYKLPYMLHICSMVVYELCSGCRHLYYGTNLA